MSQTPLNFGSSVEDGTGDTLRATFAKIQSNFTDLDTRLTSTTALARVNATGIATEVARAQTVEALKAPIFSPTFTGVPTAPTAAAGTGTTQIATTQFVASAVAAAGGGGGGSGSGVPTTRQVQTAGAATGGGDLSADRIINVPIAAQADVATGTDNAKVLTSLSVVQAFAAKAPLNSPQFTGTPIAPTAMAGTSTTQLATTAFVGAALNALPFLSYGSAQNRSLAEKLQARQNAGTRGAGLLVKTAAYPVQPADIGTFLACNGTFALPLPAASAAGNGFSVEVKNTGTGVVTLTPSGSDQVDGLAALNLYPGECCTVSCDGATWRTLGLSTGLVLLSTSILSATPAASFTRFDPARFSSYVLDLVSVTPAVDNNFLCAACSADGGATYRSGPTDYSYAYWNTQQDGATGATSANGNSSLVMSNNISNQQGISGQIEVRPAALTGVNWLLKSSNYSGPKLCNSVGGGHTGTTTAFQIFVSSGNLASGQITMYGRR